MLALIRAGVFAALVTLASVFFASQTIAADKPFERAELADAAVKLEAQIKSEASNAGKPLAQIRRELDTAFQKNDFRNGMTLLGQLVAAAPADSAGWLRLARTIQQIRTGDERERTMLLERAGTAAYKAYTLTKNRGEEADSLLIIGRTQADLKKWRPALDA